MIVGILTAACKHEPMGLARGSVRLHNRASTTTLDGNIMKLHNLRFIIPVTLALVLASCSSDDDSGDSVTPTNPGDTHEPR